MGTSTDAILAYGYEIHNPDEGWMIYEPEDHVEKQVWYKPLCYCDVENEPECDCEPDVMEILDKALDGTPFTTTIHCHIDHSTLMIVASPITAGRGEPRYLDLSALEEARTDGDGWDAQFDDLWQRLRITPKAEGPRWILASFWG